MARSRWAVALVLASFLSLCSGPPARAEDDLAAKIEAITNSPVYRQARWGILVVDAHTGETVYEHDADRLFLPASTTKLFSCSTALAALGPQHRFETPVYRRGDVKEGRLKGDLILVARGDLTLGGRDDGKGHMAFKDHDHTYANGNDQAELTDTDPLAGLKDLARQIAAAGIRRVDGEVLVDDRLFVKARGSGSGPDVLSPIVVNDNVVDFLITPAAEAGKPAAVRMRPETAWVQVDAQVTTVEEGKPTKVEIFGPAPQRCVIRGEIPLKAKPLVRIMLVDDPSAFARALFIEALRREGVAVNASPLVPPQAELPERAGYDGLTRVAKHTSLPFSEVVKVTLKVSHNLYASTLPLLVAVKHDKRTLQDGLRLQRKYLADFGVTVDAISFAGGAGGANADSVTPRAAVQLLQGFAKRPEYAALQAGLPVLGVDGTLSDMAPPSSLAQGKVRAKTGTLFWYDALNDRALLRSKALAGVMTTAGERPLVFAMFVNDLPLPAGVHPNREGKVLGRLCEIIYRHAPSQAAP
jgi:D-alanyl-D-alanine carboxypeptidase/D-alanyl-D-alanine-endopeptidase (penicillin-binding protein 4)